MSEPETPKITTEPTEPAITKPTVTKEETPTQEVDPVTKDKYLELVKEVKAMRKEAKQERTDKLVLEATEKRNTKLAELKKVNKTLFEKYKDESDISKIEQAIEDAPLIKKGFPKLVDDKKKDDSTKIPTGFKPGTKELLKF